MAERQEHKAARVYFITFFFFSFHPLGYALLLWTSNLPIESIVVCWIEGKAVVHSIEPTLVFWSFWILEIKV